MKVLGDRRGVCDNISVHPDIRLEPEGAMERNRITTTVSLNPTVWALLRRMAGEYSEANGGRPNVSAVVERLTVEEVAREKREVHADA